MSKKDSDIVAEEEVEIGKIMKRRDGILIFQAGEGVHTATLPQLKEKLKVYKRMNNGKRFPFFSDNRSLRGMGDVEKEFIKSSFSEFATCAANLVDSPSTKFLHNVFLSLYNLPIPLKTFTDKDKAFAWLKTYLDKNDESDANN